MSSLYTEEQLISRIKKNDVTAFEIIYRDNYRAVYANILKIVKETDLAENLLQEVFVSLWQYRSALKETGSVKGWLFVVSYNKSLKFLKERLRDVVFYVESYDHLGELAEKEDDESTYQFKVDLIHEAVSHLSKRRQEVFKRCRYEHKSKEEVAVEMGLSIESVKDYLKQSHKLIRQYILNKYPNGTVSVIGLLFFIEKF